MAPLSSPQRRPGGPQPRIQSLALAGTVAAALLLAACQPKPSQELLQLQQRQEQLELKLQQLEQKLNAATPRDPAERGGKPPAGPIRSVTYRSGTADDRLRIYWADGSTSDLPCTKEQSTLACG